MTLATQRVIAAEAVVNVRRAILQESVEIFLADPEEVLAGDALDEAGDQRRRRAGLFARTVEALTQVTATRLASSADAASSSKRAFATR